MAGRRYPPPPALPKLPLRLLMEDLEEDFSRSSCDMSAASAHLATSASGEDRESGMADPGTRRREPEAEEGGGGGGGWESRADGDVGRGWCSGALPMADHGLPSAPTPTMAMAWAGTWRSPPAMLGGGRWTPAAAAAE